MASSTVFLAPRSLFDRRARSGLDWLPWLSPRRQSNRVQWREPCALNRSEPWPNGFKTRMRYQRVEDHLPFFRLSTRRVCRVHDNIGCDGMLLAVVSQSFDRCGIRRRIRVTCRMPTVFLHAFRSQQIVVATRNDATWRTSDGREQ